MTDPLHIPLWGAAISTPHVAASSAVVSASVAVRNAMLVTATAVAVSVVILGPDGKAVGHGRAAPVRVLANSTLSPVVVNITLAGPVARWSTSTPLLHTANITVTAGGPNGSEDQVSVPFGVRSVSFSAETGLLLNGVQTKLYGGCVHHDNGPLGAMAIDRAEERRVSALKALGYNAIRTSHNPVSPAFLDACDRLGMLVMDEAFDCWGQVTRTLATRHTSLRLSTCRVLHNCLGVGRVSSVQRRLDQTLNLASNLLQGKNPDDYHLYFWKWWQRDLAALVLRDRNHPSGAPATDSRTAVRSRAFPFRDVPWCACQS